MKNSVEKVASNPLPQSPMIWPKLEHAILELPNFSKAGYYPFGAGLPCPWTRDWLNKMATLPLSRRCLSKPMPWTSTDPLVANGGGQGEGRSFFYYFLSRHTMQAARLVARTLLRARAPASRLVCIRTTGSCFFLLCFTIFAPLAIYPPPLCKHPLCASAEGAQAPRGGCMSQRGCCLHKGGGGFNTHVSE